MARSVAYGAGKDLLLRGVVEIVAERGLRGLTFRALAEYVGVNNSLVAHHFGTREALLCAALDQAVASSVELTGNFDLGSAEGFAVSMLESVEAHAELQLFQYEMVLEARRNPVFRQSVDRLYGSYRDLVSRSLIDIGVGGDIDVIAGVVSTTIDGVVLQRTAGVPPDRLREVLIGLWQRMIEPEIS